MANRSKSSKPKSDEIEYEIVEHIGTLGSPSEKGWVKEVNLIRWGDSTETKWDIRGWNREGEEIKMTKGITLSDAEFSQLQSLLR